MNYKICVENEAESKEAQELFFALGYVWHDTKCQTKMKYTIPVYYSSFDDGDLCCDLSDLAHNHKEITLPQLRDLVVLKRNDPKDENVYQDGDVPCLYNLYLTSDKNLYFFSCGKGWKLSAINDDDDYRKLLKPITKEPIMKEFLSPDQGYKLVCCAIGETSIPENWIEVPGGADTLAGGERTRYFWKHGVGVKGNMLIGCGESLSRYPKWDDCEDSADEWLGQINRENSGILWQRETLNDKVASAEVARQEFIGAPFSDLPEFNFEAVDEFVESNVEQDNVNQPSHYCSHPSGIECIEITRYHDFTIGNAIKYLWRAGLKDSADEIQDLKKASWYIQDKINQLKKLNDNP